MLWGEEKVHQDGKKGVKRLCCSDGLSLQSKVPIDGGAYFRKREKGIKRGWN